MPDDYKEYLNAPDDPNEEQLLVNLLKSVNSSDQSLFATAQRELFAIEHLSVGKMSPEIRGHDLNGTEFRLSEYRGKVVLLSFWGDW